jgi:hypothetical protein
MNLSAFHVSFLLWASRVGRPGQHAHLPEAQISCPGDIARPLFRTNPLYCRSSLPAFRTCSPQPTFSSFSTSSPSSLLCYGPRPHESNGTVDKINANEQERSSGVENDEKRELPDGAPRIANEFRHRSRNEMLQTRDRREGEKTPECVRGWP